jgi:hypothetical protein
VLELVPVDDLDAGSLDHLGEPPARVLPERVVHVEAGDLLDSLGLEVVHLMHRHVDVRLGSFEYPVPVLDRGDDGVARSHGDERHLGLGGDGHHRQARRALAGGDDHVDLVVGDELLDRLHGLVGLGLVVVDDDLDGPLPAVGAGEPARGVHLLLEHDRHVPLGNPEG